MIRSITPALTVLTAVFAGNVLAQGLPATDLWLVTLDDGAIGDPVKINVTKGYNNQPHFSADGSIIFYTREMPTKEGVKQTDVAVFNLRTSATTMLTNTPESEFSPTPIPGRDAVSVIRQDLQQKQLLYAIDVNNGKMDLLFPNVEPVGYHAWFSDDEAAMFILGDSFTLQTAQLNIEGTKVVADNIGRSIRKHPKTTEILFVDKNHEPWQIAAYDPDADSINNVTPLFPGNEDFTIDANGDYWTGNGSKLYKRSPGDGRWELMADFSTFGINHISRLATHLENGKLALVSD